MDVRGIWELQPRLVTGFRAHLGARKADVQADDLTFGQRKVGWTSARRHMAPFVEDAG
jgi:hypothetical protein